MNNLTFEKLDRKFPKSNTIAMSQHYAENLLRNPSTSNKDKMVMLDYIRARYERFTPMDDNTDNEERNEIARKINGNNPKKDFLTNLSVYSS